MHFSVDGIELPSDGFYFLIVSLGLWLISDVFLRIGDILDLNILVHGLLIVGGENGRFLLKLHGDIISIFPIGRNIVGIIENIIDISILIFRGILKARVLDASAKVVEIGFHINARSLLSCVVLMVGEVH